MRKYYLLQNANLRHVSTALFFALFLNISFFNFSAKAQNAIVTENMAPGATDWRVDQTDTPQSRAGDLALQGFATQISYNKGETAVFKIKCDPDISTYTVKIYRLGYYGGNGATYKGLATITEPMPLVPQPACSTIDPADLTGNSFLLDCGTWHESAIWPIPNSSVSGIYIAKLSGIHTNNGTNNGKTGTSHIVFVVRDDLSNSDLLFQTSDATWQAYNSYGDVAPTLTNPCSNEKSFYVGCGGIGPTPNATKISYNRPFRNRNLDGIDTHLTSSSFLFEYEFPMLRWLEKNGYDVSYTTCVDTDQRGTLITRHKCFMSVGHDEYWSQAARENVVAARDAGVNLAFFSSNEIYWKVRWEGNYRTLVCYKEGTIYACDDSSTQSCRHDPTPDWTGVWEWWHDTSSSCPMIQSANNTLYPAKNFIGKPSNELTGQFGFHDKEYAIEVPALYKNFRFWRNSIVSSMSGSSITLAPKTLGYEWASENLAKFHRSKTPNGRILLSENLIPDVQAVINNIHHLSLYKHPVSGALVFGSGTMQWVWGLDEHHDRNVYTPNYFTPSQNVTANVVGPELSDPATNSLLTSPAIQQATINLLADMGAAPGSIQSGLSYSAPVIDNNAPTCVIGSPANSSSIASGTTVQITGTATDLNVVAGVEVSIDGGVSWQRAALPNCQYLPNHSNAWRFDWIATPNSPSSNAPVVIQSRAFDDSGNISSPVTSSVTVTSQVMPSSIFLLDKPSATPSPGEIVSPNAETPNVPMQSTRSNILVGTKIKSSTYGFITKARFYKQVGNNGSHIGLLYSGTGCLLAHIDFTSETSSGWQEATFLAPVAITPNTTYIIALYTYNTDINALKHYSEETPYFTQAKTSGALTALANNDGTQCGNAIFIGDLQGNSAAGYPPALVPKPSTGGTNFNSSLNNYKASNYWVDVVFSPAPLYSLIPRNTTQTGTRFDNTGVQLGMKFSTTTAGLITKMYFRKVASDTTSHIGQLYDGITKIGSDATNFSTSPGTPAGSGWVEATFPTPIPIQPGHTYTISYFSPKGYYYIYYNYFNPPTPFPLTNGPLAATPSAATSGSTGNGVGIYSNIPACPIDSYYHTNHFVDIEFMPFNPANGCTSMRPSQQTLTTNKMTTGDDAKSALQLSVSPNPFSTSFHVTFSTPIDGPTEVIMYDARGNQVRSLFKASTKNAQTNQIEVQTNNLATGLYMLKMVSGNKTANYKVVLMR